MAADEAELANGRWAKPLVRAQRAKEAVDPTAESVAAPPTPPTAGSTADRPADRDPSPEAPGDLAWVEERLAAVARVAGRHDRALTGIDDRLNSFEGGLAALEELATSGSARDRLDALERRLERLERLQEEASADQRDGAPVAPEPASEPPAETAPSGDVASVIDLLVDLDNRVTQLEALPSVMGDIAVEHFRGVASEFLPASGDIDGVYKELDTIRERVAAHDASVAGHAERASRLDQALDRLQGDVGEVIDRLTVVADRADATIARMARLEERVEALQSSVDGGPSLPDGQPDAPSPVAAPSPVPEPPPHPGSPTVPPSGATHEEAFDGVRAKAVEVLTGELHRILQSLEALGAPTPPPRT